MRAKIGLNKSCQVCNKFFYVPPSFKDQKFCSTQCYYENKKGLTPWNKGIKMPESFMKKLGDRPQHFGLGHIPHNKGKSWSEEIKKKISENRKGKAMGKDNSSNRPEQRERNRLRMKKVWGTPIERQRYSKGWFQKGDPRFKSDPVFIEGMKKGGWNKGDKRLLKNKFGFKKGQIPPNKTKLPPEYEIRKLYEKEMRDTREIAEIYGSNMNTVLRWLDNYKIKKRKSLYGYNNKIVCKAGHKVDSIGERKIADFLLENGISYFHNKTINKQTKKRYDFYLPKFDIYIEYLGLIGKDFYDKKQVKKIEYYNKYGLKCIFIKPGQNIDKILKILVAI